MAGQALEELPIPVKSRVATGLYVNWDSAVKVDEEVLAWAEAASTSPPETLTVESEGEAAYLLMEAVKKGGGEHLISEELYRRLRSLFGLKAERRLGGNGYHMGRALLELGVKPLVSYPCRPPAIMYSSPIFKVAHKGRLRITLTVPGRASHASRPEEGINPIIRAAEVISGMKPLSERFSEREHPLLGPCSLVFTVVSAGEKANIIPDSCLLQMDARVVPPWTVEEAREEIETFVGRLSDELGFEISVRVEALGRPAATPPDEPLVRTAMDAVEVCGVNQEGPEGFGACCDMQHFRAAGVPTIILGPGELSQAHTTDESVKEEEILRAVRVYRELVRRFLC